MDSSIKPKPLIGEILPGYTFLVLFLFYYFRAHPCQFEWILSMGGGVTVATSGLVLIVSWIVGDFFDALREVIEEAWDQLLKHFKKPTLNWDFFFEADREKTDQLEDYYYSYYELDINFTVAIGIFLLTKLALRIWDPGFLDLLSWKMCIALFGAMLVFFADAMVLRKEIKKHTNGKEGQAK